MKRLAITLIMVSALFCSASAQGNFIEHLTIGINYGTTSMSGTRPMDYFPFCRQTDGAGIEVAAQINDWLDARVGFSITTLGGETSGFSVEGVPDGKFITQKLEVVSDYGAMSGNLFFDFYPFRTPLIHFTAGAYAGSNTLLKIYSRTEVTGPLASYNAGVLEMNGMTIPTDRNGKIAARLKMPAVRPYVGVGISTGRMDSDLVIFSARLGAMYKGSKGMTIAGPDGKDVEVDYWSSDTYHSRLVRWNKKCAVAPMLTLSLYIRLF